MNRSFSVFTVCTLLLLVTACQNKEIIPESSESESKSKEEVPAVTVTGVSISPASHSMEVGETVQMEAIILPENATNKNVSWISLSPIVASVNETGLVTAHKQGNATIRVTTEQGRFIAECKITVGSTDTPPDTTPDPQPSGRWTDSGADVPAYPTYNTVSSKSDFPLVEIRTDSGNQPASKEYYEGGTVRFSDPKGMYKGQNDTDYSTDSGTLKMQIRGRGNSTWEGQNGSKNPYRIKLDEHTKVFGMKGDKDWILLSDKLDKSLIRTAVALRISRLVSMPWTPKYRMVHMTLNGKDKGLYYLVEQKEVDRDNKIPITIQPGVVDSGYLLELDNKWDNDDYFQSECFGKFVKYKDPDPNDEDSSQKMTSAQKKFITDYFNSVEHALEDRNWDKVHSLIEMDSWIQNYLVHEVTMNKDGNMRLSTYFAKDSDTKLFMPMV